ncbi:MAG: endonuclease V [Flammeovirgaceae bacterium]
MIGCLDVFYKDNTASAAAVFIERWTDDRSFKEYVIKITGVAEYVSGEFFKRELPCVLQILEHIKNQDHLNIEVLVIDGYVWLSEGRKGLGAYLFEALGGKIPVVGVAKSYFHQNNAVQVFRGKSQKPLYVSAIGVDVTCVAKNIQAMEGKHRIPSILKRVDALSKGITD